MEKKYYPRLSYSRSEANKTLNPSFGISQKFGSRVFSEQSVLEVLSEFLNVVKSNKSIKSIKDNENEVDGSKFFPDLPLSEIESFSYKDEANLNLKLFSLFLCSSDSSVHPSHETHYYNLKKQLENIISITDSSKQFDNEKVIGILENLFMGFQGVGVNRDWCGQSFLPVRKEFLAGETMWDKTTSNKKYPNESDINETNKFFNRNKHNLYARTGEVIYLEIYSALNKDSNEINELCESTFKNIKITNQERNPKYLKAKITKGLDILLNQKSPQVLGDLANLINGLNNDIDKKDSNGEVISNKIEIGWIPEDNWQYGYLLAVELSRIFSSDLDIIDEIDMLQNLFILHTLRRFLFISSTSQQKDMPLMAVIDSNTKNNYLKDISKHSFKMCIQMINDETNSLNIEQTKRNIDRYGSGAFKKWAKAISFVVPKTGDATKFVLNNNILNCLISTTLLPNEQMLLPTFLEQVKYRFGMVFDNEGFNEINRRLGKKQNIVSEETIKWLEKMLDDSGYLIQLSDYMSLVKNVSVEQE